MEAFYHRVLHAPDKHLAVMNFPVVAVGGMTHMQCVRRTTMAGQTEGP